MRLAALVLAATLAVTMGEIGVQVIKSHGPSWSDSDTASCLKDLTLSRNFGFVQVYAGQNSDNGLWEGSKDVIEDMYDAGYSAVEVEFYLYPREGRDNVADTKNAAQWLLDNNVRFNRIWLSVFFQPTGTKYWDCAGSSCSEAECAANLEILKDVVEGLNELNVPLGIYTRGSSWDTVMCNPTPNPFGNNDEAGTQTLPLAWFFIPGGASGDSIQPSYMTDDWWATHDQSNVAGWDDPKLHKGEWMHLAAFDANVPLCTYRHFPFYSNGDRVPADRPSCGTRGDLKPPGDECELTLDIRPGENVAGLAKCYDMEPEVLADELEVEVDHVFEESTTKVIDGCAKPSLLRGFGETPWFLPLLLALLALLVIAAILAMTTTRKEPEDDMSTKRMTAITAAPATPYKSGFTEMSRMSGKTAPPAAAYASGYTEQTRMSGVTADPAVSYASGFTRDSKMSGVTADTAATYQSGFTGGASSNGSRTSRGSKKRRSKASRGSRGSTGSGYSGASDATRPESQGFYKSVGASSMGATSNASVATRSSGGSRRSGGSRKSRGSRRKSGGSKRR